MLSKIFFSLIVLLYSFSCIAQKNITGLINAEKAFAKYALDSNTRDAFVKFLDTNCVVFNNGNAINGYQLWMGREKRPQKLIWEPEFAAISSSNDYGVTTGPWEFKQTLTDTAIARGNFTSIWYYHSKSEWKNILDLGIGYNQKHNVVETVHSIELKGRMQDDGNIALQDNNFVTEYKTKGRLAYKSIAAKNCWFNTNGYLPVSGINAIDEAIKVIPDGIEFSPLGLGISKNRDFGYVYGTVTLNNKKDNYLRVWIKEDGKWKLLLQTLGIGE
jgi:hypothetical protein